MTLAQNTPTDFKISESETFKYDKKIDEVLAMKTTKAGKTAVVLAHQKRNVFDKAYLYFDIFDKGFNQVFSKQVEIDKEEIYIGDIYYDGVLKLFTVYKPNRKERTVFLYEVKINENSYKRSELFYTKINKKQNLFASKKNHVTNFAISPDKKYFALATDNVSKKINDYDIRVFNSETNQLLYKTSYQRDDKRTYEHNDLIVGNDAVVYSIGKRKLSKKAKKKLKGDSDYKFVLNKITKDMAVALDITLDDKRIQSLNISNINNELHLVGFYSNKNEYRLKGGCNFVVDRKSFSIVSKAFKPLPKQVYEDLYNSKASERKDKKKKELSNFYIDHVITTDKKETYLIAEEFYVTSNYVQTGQYGGYWNYIYHYDDILILKFNNNGDIAWGRSIFKRATAPSYNVFFKNGKLHVLLNSGKNLKVKKDGRVKVSQGFLESSALYDVEFSDDSKVIYKKIQDNKNETTYSPYYGTYELNRFIMPNDGGKQKQFMILE
jgi:hypothetical protein